MRDRQLFRPLLLPPLLLRPKHSRTAPDGVTPRAESTRALAATAMLFGAAMTAAMTATPTTAMAATAEPEFTLVLHEHRFAPAEITVPAGKRVRLVVDNQDAAPEEFDSHALNREKVIPGGAKATIYIGPLAPGRYEFIGEFNATTARGAVVAK